MFRVSPIPPARPRAGRTFLAGLAVAAMLAAGALLPTDAARATEIYRYKDPFGVWRAMKVPNGYAKYYKRPGPHGAARQPHQGLPGLRAALGRRRQPADPGRPGRALGSGAAIDRA
ncbi:hypothetical protein WJ972_28105 [Achromobacter insuavis]